ncbi:hypothetical protein Naga_100107g3 [Nannochloropsis gaditana]|uniref:Uncharacterized protein n=1 Tax=Nannochloropsis gaditana TaxID=72520 RepID=W7TVB3_9STRA|nr:hypothetical protein Naga_100107g3 [Nannochloropsis gaditana]
MMMRAPLPATASAFPGPGGGGGGGSGIGGGGGQAGSSLRGANPSRIHAAVPALAPQQRTVVLQRILKDQATFLATQSTPSADLGSETLSWYWDSSEKRTHNLEYMYRAILNFCLFRVPIQDRRIVKALICLCQSSTQACASSQTRCGIPNWFTSALLLWMTLQEFQEQASASRGAEAPNKKPDPPPPMQSESDPDVEGGRNPGEGPAGHVGGKEEERNSGKGAGKTNWTIFCPFVKQQCRPQVVTFLHIIRLQLQAEEFLYMKLEKRTPRLWISRSGLPALPVECLLAIVRFVKQIFEGDMEIGRLAQKAEGTVLEIVAERGEERKKEG